MGRPAPSFDSGGEGRMRSKGVKVQEGGSIVALLSNLE